jgi:hypothetical protein
MNLGNIDNPKTQPARLYNALKRAAARGVWLSTRDISNMINSYAPSTVISQVREQLPDGERIEHVADSFGGQTIHRYRLRAGRLGQASFDEISFNQPWTGEPGNV